MRHRKRGRQLGRQTKHRSALFRSLVTSLLEHERIETTEAKAKELRGLTDRMITLGKQGDLAARRQALAYIRQKSVVASLFSDVAERFRDRNGGYTRIIHTRRRVGDAAPMVTIELVAKRSATTDKKSAGSEPGKATAKSGEPAKTEKAAAAS